MRGAWLCPSADARPCGRALLPESIDAPLLKVQQIISIARHARFVI
jgi:hypothetical protein